MISPFLGGYKEQLRTVSDKLDSHASIILRTSGLHLTLPLSPIDLKLSKISTVNKS